MVRSRSCLAPGLDVVDAVASRAPRSRSRTSRRRGVRRRPRRLALRRADGAPPVGRPARSARAAAAASRSHRPATDSTAAGDAALDRAPARARAVDGSPDAGRFDRPDMSAAKGPDRRVSCHWSRGRSRRGAAAVRPARRPWRSGGGGRRAGSGVGGRAASRAARSASIALYSSISTSPSRSTAAVRGAGRCVRRRGTTATATAIGEGERGQLADPPGDRAAGLLVGDAPTAPTGGRAARTSRRRAAPRRSRADAEERVERHRGEQQEQPLRVGPAGAGRGRCRRAR